MDKKSGHKKVLLVDDNQDVQDILAEKLGSENIEILKAENGKDGLAKAFENKPDLILLDILMPKMDGLAVLEELRKDDWGKDVNVIMLTNLSGLEGISKAVNQGHIEYIVKTETDLAKIADKVRTTLGLD